MSEQIKKNQLLIFVEKNDPIYLCLQMIKREKDIYLNIVDEVYENIFFKDIPINMIENFSKYFFKIIYNNDIKNNTSIILYDSTYYINHSLELLLLKQNNMLCSINNNIIFNINDNKSNCLHCNSIINFYTKYPSILFVTEKNILNNFSIIIEYFEDYFPHPPLMPIYPQKRFNFRLIMNKITNNIFPIIYQINQKIISSDEKIKFYTNIIIEWLYELKLLLKNNNYILGDKFTILDLLSSVILYFIVKNKIMLPNNMEIIIDYAKRLFSRNNFKKVIK